MGFEILAETYLSWTSPLPGQSWIALAAACALLWFILRVFWGRSLINNGRLGLLLIRAAAVLILIAILLGPTIVDEQAGETTRPAMVFLFDGSQSMQLGGDTNRWQEAIQFVGDAQNKAGKADSSDVQAFRFGHRLEPLVKSTAIEGESAQRSGTVSSDLVAMNQSVSDTKVRLISNSSSGDAMQSIDGPEASDSRLADALRQLLPQVNAKSSAGVVLLSDGRVRASESVERLSEIFGKSQVPIHVVPIGQAGGSGDIAIVSLVVPSRVRKYTENELQVFLRSFGYAGQQTTVRIRRKSTSPDDDSADLVSLPITLAGGAQSASLTFRVDERPEDLIVSVDPIDGELTTRNNKVETRIEIDRTKVRVLCVQSGQVAGTQSLLSRFLPIASSPTSSSAGAISIGSVLQADEDVECTTLVNMGGQSLRRINADGSIQSSVGFPRTRAELFAYDCVIFSDVTPAVLEDEQQQWLSQWIDGRGGGLIVTGTQAFVAQDWLDSPIEPLLPVALQTVPTAFPVPTPVDVTVPNHPIWRLKIEDRLNQQLIDALPELSTAAVGFEPKVGATVLAQTRDERTPVILVQRAGRGRVLVSSAALAGRALQQLSETWGAQPERVAGKLWRNMVYWATEESSTGRRRLVVRSNQRFYRPGQQLAIEATAYDEAARRSQQYRIWAMLEPESLDDMSLYSPVLWPDNVVRESGEVGPRIAWGEELPLNSNPEQGSYELQLMLSETSGTGDSGMRIELTAYEGAESENAFNHGTQVDSTSLAIQILSDPFEQQNPLPNHELLARVAAVSGGRVLSEPSQLSELLRGRKEFQGPPTIDSSPAWNRVWLWLGLIGLLSTEWVWRRMTGLA